MGITLPAAVEDQFTAIFGVDNRAAIEDATVYIKKLPDDGRKFTTRYSGSDAALVVKRAQAAVEAIDSHRSPTRTMVRQVGKLYRVDVTHYGLD